MVPSAPSFGTKAGSCGYGLIQQSRYPYFSTVALSRANRFYLAGPLNGCGQCLQIQCTDLRPGVCLIDGSTTASVVAMVSDTCPECEADHLDLQAAAFAKLSQAVWRLHDVLRSLRPGGSSGSLVRTGRSSAGSPAAPLRPAMGDPGVPPTGAADCRAWPGPHRHAVPARRLHTASRHEGGISRRFPAVAMLGVC